jgi:hypothetical protein
VVGVEGDGRLAEIDDHHHGLVAVGDLIAPASPIPSVLPIIQTVSGFISCLVQAGA